MSRISLRVVVSADEPSSCRSLRVSMTAFVRSYAVVMGYCSIYGAIAYAIARAGPQLSLAYPCESAGPGSAIGAMHWSQ